MKKATAKILSLSLTAGMILSLGTTSSISSSAAVQTADSQKTQELTVNVNEVLSEEEASRQLGLQAEQEDSEHTESEAQKNNEQPDSQGDQAPEGEPLEEGVISDPAGKNTKEDTVSSEDPSKERQPKKERKGSLSVSIVSAIEIEKDTEFAVSLTGPETKSQSVTLEASKTGDVKLTRALFEELPEGKYTITVSGAGFAAYTQELSVENMDHKIQLYTDKLAGYDYGTDGVHPGVLLIGDVTGDGVLNKADQDALIDQLEAGTYLASCDLNKDGSVDLVDLQYYAVHCEEKTPILSVVESTVPAEGVDASVENAKVEGGELSDLLDSDTTLQLAADAKISESHPVSVGFELDGQEPVEMEGLTFVSPAGSENQIEEGYVVITYVENGVEKTEEFQILPADSKRFHRSKKSVVRQPDGTFVVDFGGQIAVKKVTITITATSNQGNLAEISKVEFVNDMEHRIPAPQMDVPENVKTQAGNKTFTVTWDKAKNVTGYEVKITCEGKSEYRKTSLTSMDINSFGNKKLINKKEYVVQVQSLNGEWKSGYSKTATAVPMPTEKPPAPDMLKVNGKYQALDLSWKDMEDTDAYNIYYKEDSADQYKKISGVKGTKYTIEGLKDNTKYNVYLTGINDLGEGPASMISAGTTVILQPAKLPAYGLINQSKGEGVLSAHIERIVFGRGAMYGSTLDEGGEGNSGLGLADNSYESYLQVDDWDDGGAYPGPNKGVTVTFDDRYEIGTIALAEAEDIGSYAYVNVQYWDEKDQKKTAPASIQQKRSENGRAYYIVRLAEPITTNKILIGVGRYGSSPKKVVLAELRFYAYNSLESDIMGLYADDLHTTLRDDVTADEMDALQKRLDTADTVSGEYHPDREMLQKELDTARSIFESAAFDTVTIQPGITAAKDKHLGFGGLNAWQPLGVSAYAQEELVVYVGSANKKTGEKTNLQLVATQVHGEANALAKIVADLKVGVNYVTIPSIQSVDVEQGGALYVQYTGNRADDVYGIRVSGGTKIPVLNLYQVTDPSKREQLIAAYVKELNAHCKDLEKNHEALHKASGAAAVDYTYDCKTCILNTTDILLDQMMISIPASQVQAGLQAETEAKQIERLSQSVQAMEDMMHLFYQHKGLSNASDAAAQNRLPSQHLNIRYMKMFAGAFMYAGGNHIGIEWDSTPGLMRGVPVQSENGKYISGNYFGWGIAHEIGHNINQNVYSVAEVTNNYFSVLAQAKDSNDSVRFSYDEVYDKVTSRTTGASDNVFTQLGLYWQLHLAYDEGYNYKTYDTWTEQFDHLFFARVDTYARNTASAPAPKGIALTLGSDKNQNLMRLAIAAAQKDLLEFFERWGMEPDETTTAYAKQFEKEERAIYYASDDARVYALEHAGSATVKDKDVISDTVKAEVNPDQPNYVTLHLENNFEQPESILGYEIIRKTTSGGKQTRTVVGFTTEDTYTDEVASFSNRVITYEVAAVDQFLNRSQIKTLNAVKIEGDGMTDKTDWTIHTNMVSEADSSLDATEQDPCEPEKVPASGQMIDRQLLTTYTGVSSEEDPVIVLQMNKSVQVSALRYVLSSEGTAMDRFRVEVSQDGEHYQTVKEGRFDLQGKQADTVYFQNADQDPWVATYDASYVRITALGQKGKEISVSELDLLGPVGDNISFAENGIGVLKHDYVYDKVSGAKIPAGSVVFTGSYTGNPAYNVVMLYDEEGKIVGGVSEDGTLKAHQIILAEVPEAGELGNTSDGTWVYWIEPGEDGAVPELPGQVRGELYRVDDAMTNVGQRLVSDTLFTKLPDNLPDVDFQ